MDLKVFKGKITALGDTSSFEPTTKQPSITTYSNIKMSDGQRIKKLFAETGLDDKFQSAKSAGEEVELHVILHPEGTAGLVAIKTGDGKIFAKNISEEAKAKHVWVKAGWIGGVLLTPLFGLGLIILWQTWQLHKMLASYDECRAYIASLPNATYI